MFRERNSEYQQSENQGDVIDMRPLNMDPVVGEEQEEAAMAKGTLSWGSRQATELRAKRLWALSNSVLHFTGLKINLQQEGKYPEGSGRDWWNFSSCCNTEVSNAARAHSCLH